MTSARADAGRDRKVRKFVQRLSREEVMLIVLKRELYEGNWLDMSEDLNARWEGRPYSFNLVTRSSDDLERISRLQQFEQQNGVDLSDYVELP